MGKFEYTADGGYVLNRRPGHAHWMSFVAGGSGITPCYAVSIARVYLCVLLPPTHAFGHNRPNCIARATGGTE